MIKHCLTFGFSSLEGFEKYTDSKVPSFEKFYDRSVHVYLYGVQSWTKVDCMTQTEMNGRLALGSSKKCTTGGFVIHGIMTSLFRRS